MRARRSNINFSKSNRSNTGNVTIMAEQKMDRPKFGVTILDEQGNDVTPKALYTDQMGAKSQLLMNDQQSVGTPTDAALSFASMFQTATQSVYAQPFSRSIYSNGNRSTSRRSSDGSSAGQVTETTAHEITTAFDDVTTIRREKKEVLTENDLNKIVHISLEETETFWFYEQAGVRVSGEAEDSEDIIAKNQAYEELLRTREGNSRFTERGMQTFNNAPKTKDVQAEKVGMSDAGAQVTSWDMYDTYEEQGQDDSFDEEERAQSVASNHKSVRSMSAAVTRSRKNSAATDHMHRSKVNASIQPSSESSHASTSVAGFDQTMSSMRPPSSISVRYADPAAEIEKQWNSLVNMENFIEQMLVMERVVTENIYQPKLAAYRGLPIYLDVYKEELSESEGIGGVVGVGADHSSEIMEALGPTLERLWSYNCPLTMGKNVSCFAWNKVNPDILAVGYGSFNFVEQNKNRVGLACCWNLKNLEYPERIYHCKASVSAMDFSQVQPNLLAVGCTDGTVCVYNVRSREDAAILDSFDCPGKHASPVWQLKWIERDNHEADNNNERLVSVAADGRVVEWSIRKGLECTDLMKLKRSVAKPAPVTMKKKEKPEALLSRQAPGMSFDFHPKDSSMYLAGTEEGMIHKCSCSYNEQFLDTFIGHTGSVYKVKWSPFSEDIFLSCSSDWSIRVWEQSDTKPALNLLSTTKAVHDVCWSPYSSTVFCVVNEGAIEIWDLSVNILDPIIINLASSSTKMSSCTFANNSNSVVIGDSDGNVTVYQLRNVKDEGRDEMKGATVLDKIINVSYTNLKESQSGQSSNSEPANQE